MKIIFKRKPLISQLVEKMTFHKYKNYRFVRLIRLITIRFRLGFKNWRHMVGFLTEVVPPINFLFSVLCNFIARQETNTVSSRVYFALLDSGIGWGGLRHIDPRTKTRVAAKYRHYYLKNGKSDDQSGKTKGEYKTELENLSTLGYASLGVLFDKQEVSDAIQFFSKQKYFAAQVPIQGDLIPRDGFLENYEKDESRYRSLLPSVSMKCPQIEKFLQFAIIKSLSKSYLEMEAPMYSINTFATFPGASDHYVLHEHRDYDHFLSLVFFIAWTETTYDDGATFYIPNSHISAHDSGRWVPLEAKAGEVIAVDTFGKHSGNSKLKAPRIATWVRFGRIPNYAWLLDGNSELIL